MQKYERERESEREMFTTRDDDRYGCMQTDTEGWAGGREERDGNGKEGQWEEIEGKEERTTVTQR